MSYTYQDEEFLNEIELDIEKNYGLKNPIFIIHKKKITREEILNWFGDVLCFYRVVKYKHLSNNHFELKTFYPAPSDQVCQRFVNNFFIAFEQVSFSLDIFFQLGNIIYTKSQAKKKLFLKLKMGWTLFSFQHKYIPDPDSNKKRLIIRIDIMESHRIRSRIESELVVLEYKD